MMGTDDHNDMVKTRLRLWLRLLKVSRHIESELRENLRQEYATTLPRFDVMAALERFPDGLRMSELSDVLMVSNGNVTGIVERLVGDGCIERIAVPKDRRASQVRLTPKGLKVFAQQATAHAGWIDRLFASFDGETAANVTDMLEKVNISSTKKGMKP